MADNNEIVIRSEQDAYDTLELAAAGKLPDNVDVRFDGWPQLAIVVRGDKYQGTITPSIMQGFLEFQKAIYRTFALTKYNSVNINRLTNEEKDALELCIKVDEGSSIFSIDFQALLERFVERAGANVTPKSLIIIALIVATGYFGASSYKAYLNSRQEIRLAQIESDTRKAELEERKYADEIDLKRMQILADATKAEPRAANVREYAEDAQLGIVKSVRKADQSTIAGVEIEGSDAQELIKNARRTSREVRLDGIYKVQVVDASQIDVFKIRVRDETTGEEFIATVQDESLENRVKETIRDAEWAKQPVQLTINAKVVGDDIRSATVIGAQEPPPAES